jgi:hypothetical protein
MRSPEKREALFALILAPCADLNPIAGAETTMVSKFS